MRKIGFGGELTGRMGNQLLQLLLLKEIAYKCDLKPYYDSISAQKFMYGATRTKGLILNKMFGRNSLEITKEDFVNKGVDGVIASINESDGDIVMDPSILGFTLQTMFTDVNQFFSIKEKFHEKYIDNSEKTVVLHYRGTDFKGWNPESILSADYYLQSIDYISNAYVGEELNYILLTDDLELDSLNKTISYLKDKKAVYYVGSPSNSVGKDLYNISIADVVVSSPSTFAIFGSFLGNDKKVIHNKGWVEKRASLDDTFWVDVLNNRCDKYPVMALI